MSTVNGLISVKKKESTRDYISVLFSAEVIKSDGLSTTFSGKLLLPKKYMIRKLTISDSAG